MSESDTVSMVESPPATPDHVSEHVPNNQFSEEGNSAKNPAVKPKVHKVEVLLKATGDAPIIKQKKWALEPGKKIGFISEFIKKVLKCEPHESLFLYVNQAFAPSPDTEVGTLYDCFGSDGKLILHYCKTQAWG